MLVTVHNFGAAVNIALQAKPDEDGALFGQVRKPPTLFNDNVPLGTVVAVKLQRIKSTLAWVKLQLCIFKVFKFGAPVKLVDQLVNWFLYKIILVNEDGKLLPSGIILYWLVNWLMFASKAVNPVADDKLVNPVI